MGMNSAPGGGAPRAARAPEPQQMDPVVKQVFRAMEADHRALESFKGDMPYDPEIADKLEFYPQYTSHLINMHHDVGNNPQQVKVQERIQKDLEFIQYKAEEYCKWANLHSEIGLKPNMLQEQYLKLFIKAVKEGWIDDKEQVIKQMMIAGKQKQKAEFFELAEILMKKYKVAFGKEGGKEAEK